MIKIFRLGTAAETKRKGWTNQTNKSITTRRKLPNEEKNNGHEAKTGNQLKTQKKYDLFFMGIELDRNNLKQKSKISPEKQ